MRDRLIEILKRFCTDDCKITHQCGYCDFGDLTVCPSAVADHLLANGVIVPPCKVGQTVYVTDKKSVQEYTVHAVECDEKYLTIKCHSWLAEREGLLHKHTAYFNLNDFGKTVFLTKELAEKALAERSGE